MAEVLITSKQQLEAAFSKVPAAYVERQKHLEAIAAEMRRQFDKIDRLSGFKLAVTVDAPKQNTSCTDWFPPCLNAFVNGVDMWPAIEFVAEMQQLSSWRSNPTGRVRISAGNFGNRQSYPPRKDGTYNYESIASKLLSGIASRCDQAVSEKQRLQGDALADQINKELGVSEFSSPIKGHRSTHTHKGYKSYPAEEGRVYFELCRQLTPEQAKKLYAFIQAL